MDLDALKQQHSEEFLNEVFKVVSQYEKKLPIEEVLFSLQLMICNVANEIAPSSEEAADFVYDMVDEIFDEAYDSDELDEDTATDVE